MSVPNTNTFSLRDVVDELSDYAPNSLSSCFGYSNDVLFDPRYKGDKDRLSNFRNYGWYGNLIYKSTLETEQTLSAIHGPGGRDTSVNGLFFFATFLQGYVSAFNIDNAGLFARYPSNFSVNGSPTDIYCHTRSRIFVVDHNDDVGSPYYRESRLYCLSHAGSTWYLLDTYVSDYFGTPSDSKYRHVTANDDGAFVFASGDWYDGYQTIDVLSVDILGRFNHRSTFSVGVDVTAMKWVNGYLVVAAKSGSTTYLRTYALNVTNGTLSFDTSYTIPSAYGLQLGKIETDGNGLIFCAHTGTYITAWRIAGNGGISFTDSDTRGGGGKGIGYSSIAGTPISGDGSILYSFRMTDTDDYFAEDSELRDGNTNIYADFSNRFAVTWAVTFPDAARYHLHSYQIT